MVIVADPIYRIVNNNCNIILISINYINYIAIIKILEIALAPNDEIHHEEL